MRRELQLELCGCLPVHAGEVRGEIIEALCVRNEPRPWRLTPQFAGFEMRLRPEQFQSFDIARAAADQPDDQWSSLFLREENPSYEVLLRRDRGAEVLAGAPVPPLTLNKPTALTTDAIDDILALYGDLAAISQPAFGVVKRPQWLEPPWQNESEELRALFDVSSTLYRGVGPGGLGLRTYFGEACFQWLPRARLLAVPPPALVTELRWGAVQIDLLPEPFAAGEEEILRAYVSARNWLLETGFFARTYRTGDEWDAEPPAWWNDGAGAFLRIRP